VIITLLQINEIKTVSRCSVSNEFICDVSDWAVKPRQIKNSSPSQNSSTINKLKSFVFAVRH